jgi:hypothetical protein
MSEHFCNFCYCTITGHSAYCHKALHPTQFHTIHINLKSKLIYDRRSVGQSVLVSGAHLGPATNSLFSLKFSLKQFRVCYFVAPSLTRGRICNLLLLLVLASAVPRDSRPYFIVPILDTPPTWRARSPYLYPPGTGWASYTPGHWVYINQSQSQSHIMTDSQSASLSWCQAPIWDPRPIFLSP